MSRFDRVTFPNIPSSMNIEPELERYLTDMRKALDNWLTVQKQSYDDYLQKVFFKTVGLADDGTWDKVGTGLYLIIEEDGASYVIASCIMDSGVTVIHEKTASDWATSDTDGKYCLIDQTTYIQLKNRSGGAKKFAVLVITTD